MYELLRKLLFRLPAESAHDISLDMLGAVERLGLGGRLSAKVPAAPITVMGLDFANPVGLAAGLDKNGDCLNGLGALGFGFIEIGTVTPRPQPGNAQPRLFRLPQHEAIINRMGFNNLGVDHLLAQIRRRRYAGVLGINIGKNFDTPLENAVDDYVTGLRKVYDLADYVTVNISSPNTQGLRDLQSETMLRTMLDRLAEERERLRTVNGRYTPIAVKIAPDLSDEAIAGIAETLLAAGMDAVIATNTTLARVGVSGRHSTEAGGLSGRPLVEASTHVISVLNQTLAGRLPIIGVGGIFSGDDAVAKVEAGASLVQLYTGFIYRGPDLIAEAAAALAACNRFQNLVTGSTEDTIVRREVSS